ncbi:exopolysaccharide biosynthesis protein [uncultured Roseivirga sp.]|uniref:exopolysaccharide biosynthesis protein n=1 Tax=uncultured Roseivirga sp. TaxID=543088 RepID=UPI000D7ACF85|nr:exopolysaccharide biosynthesis protein [uncultured Roseivirga sp.]PWL30941.1 MAG: exopolysaccharide biosynthesis protein [Roseivirga sp. XM-24bin3]
MSSQSNYIEEEKISLGFLIRRLHYWVLFIFSKWLKIGIGTIVMILLLLAFNYLKPKSYEAKTTFVLDKDAGGGLGELGSLASLAGVNIGSLSESSVLFQMDNIEELYRSRRMIEKTLLTQVDIDGQEALMIDRFARSNKFESAWEKEGIHLTDFSKPRDNFSRTQDSLMKESVKLINETFLTVGKPNRRAAILEVGFTHKDEVLAKLFTDEHVKNVNNFYLETKTKKTAANLNILQTQADSVKRVLDASIFNLAQIDENIPNPNPLYKTSQVPYQKALIDVQANSAIYQEIVKQLELAKVAHRNQMPLIQIIDKPLYPLNDNRWSLFKTLVIGGFLGVIIMTFYFLLRQIYLSALKEVG